MSPHYQAWIRPYHGAEWRLLADMQGCELEYAWKLAGLALRDELLKTTVYGPEVEVVVLPMGEEPIGRVRK